MVGKIFSTLKSATVQSGLPESYALSPMGFPGKATAP